MVVHRKRARYISSFASPYYCWSESHGKMYKSRLLKTVKRRRERYVKFLAQKSAHVWVCQDSFTLDILLNIYCNVLRVLLAARATSIKSTWLTIAMPRLRYVYERTFMTIPLHFVA
jgi:hypothetical protein